MINGAQSKKIAKLTTKLQNKNFVDIGTTCLNKI